MLFYFEPKILLLEVQNKLLEIHIAAFCKICLNLPRHFNITLNEPIENDKKDSVSYSSSTIKNEIVKLVGDKSRNEITRQIKKAKYYIILLDCAPDVLRKEQMSQMIKYVHTDCNEKGIIIRGGGVILFTGETKKILQVTRFFSNLHRELQLKMLL